MCLCVCVCLLSELHAVFKRRCDLQLRLFLHHTARQNKSLLSAHAVDTFVGKWHANEAPAGSWRLCVWRHFLAIGGANGVSVTNGPIKTQRK